MTVQCSDFVISVHLFRHDDIALVIGMICLIAMTCTVVVVKVEP